VPHNLVLKGSSENKSLLFSRIPNDKYPDVYNKLYRNGRKIADIIIKDVSKLPKALLEVLKLG